MQKQEAGKQAKQPRSPSTAKQKPGQTKAQTPKQIEEELSKEILAAADSASLQQLRSNYLGKKGKLNALLKQISSLPAEQRSARGAELNQIKDKVTKLIDDREQQLAAEELARQIEDSNQDISLPDYDHTAANQHPVNSVRRRIEAIFHNAGYETVLGPEIETDYYNFEALNFPPLHPARSMHDTFYFSADKFADSLRRLLRTHTSTGQIRAMEAKKPPLRIICPGKTYRCDYDATHSPMFHQIEGMLIDKKVSFSDLKGTLQYFINAFFGREVKLRFRASYFPFTEPSAEVDLLWESKSKNTGDRSPAAADAPDTEEEKWLEILGCGMVHPNVLKAGGIDPREYSGFAFGLGIERMAMLYHGIDDLRLFYENDQRFLEQFA